MFDFIDILLVFVFSTLIATYFTSIACYHYYSKKNEGGIDERTYLTGQALMGYLASNIYMGEVAALNSVRVADLTLKELKNGNTSQPKK